MKTRDRISLMAISLFVCSLGLSAQEFRIGVEYETMLPAKMEFAGKFELRNTLVPKSSFYTIFQLGLKREILKNLYLGGTFRQSLAPKRSSESLLESMDDKRRYTAEMIYKFPRFDNGVRLSYRLRYHYSISSKGKTKDYLRSKLKADYKLIKDLRPYVAIEPYFHLEENELRKFRLYLGGKIDVFRIGMELSYILEVKSYDQLFMTSHLVGLYIEL